MCFVVLIIHFDKLCCGVLYLMMFGHLEIEMIDFQRYKYWFCYNNSKVSETASIILKYHGT